MNDITLKLTSVSDEIYETKKCLSFRFEKEVYTPYSVLSGIFFTECDVMNISDVEFYIDGKLIHKGFVDIIELTNDVSMIEMDVKPEWVGKSLLELNLRRKFGINVVAILQGKNVNINIDPEKPLTASMELVVIVQTSKLGKLK